METGGCLAGEANLIELGRYDALFAQQHVAHTRLLDSVHIGLAMADHEIRLREHSHQLVESPVLDGVHRHRGDNALPL